MRPLHHQFPCTVAVSPVAVLRTLVVACTLLRNCLVSTSGRTIVMFAPVSTTMGHGTLSMWPITVKLSSLWVNVPVISTTCGVKLSEWLADLTPSRPACISVKEAGSYVAACLLGYSGGNFDSHV